MNNEHNPLTCVSHCHYCTYYRAEHFANDDRYFKPYFYSWTMYNYRKKIELNPQNTDDIETFFIYFNKYRVSIGDN